MKEINNHNGWSRSMFRNVLVRVFTDIYVLCLGCEEISVKGKNPPHHLSILAPEMYQQMWTRKNIWKNCDHFPILFFGKCDTSQQLHSLGGLILQAVLQYFNRLPLLWGKLNIFIWVSFPRTGKMAFSCHFFLKVERSCGQTVKDRHDFSIVLCQLYLLDHQITSRRTSEIFFGIFWHPSSWPICQILLYV